MTGGVRCVFGGLRAVSLVSLWCHRNCNTGPGLCHALGNMSRGALRLNGTPEGPPAVRKV
jgi:hypothetical protein